MIVLLEVIALAVACFGPLIPAINETLVNDYLARNMDLAARRMFVANYWRTAFYPFVGSQLFVALAWLGRRLFGVNRRAFAYAVAVVAATVLSFVAHGYSKELKGFLNRGNGELLLIRIQLSLADATHAEAMRSLLETSPTRDDRLRQAREIALKPLTTNPFAALKPVVDFGWWWLAWLIVGAVGVGWATIFWFVGRRVLHWERQKTTNERTFHRLLRKRWLMGLILLAPAIVLALDVWPAGAPPKGSPNVILISIDTLRADHLSCYGYPRPTTPRIDALAEAGVIFDRAVSQSNTTLPAHASMLTGLYPIEHGCNQNRLTGLSSRIDTLAEILLQQGYRTAAVTSAAWVSRRFGLAAGFESFVWRDSSSWLQTKRGLKLLKRMSAQPFFLFLHYFDPHDPYMPPAVYRERFLAPGEDFGVDGNLEHFFQRVSMRSPDPRKVEALKKLYDGEIRYVDNSVDALFRWLHNHKLLDNTLVIITADHGESFGENGAWAHGTALYSQQIHVPLIIVYPPRFSPGTHRRELVEASVNLLPTILDVVGIKQTPRLGRGSLAGAAPPSPRVYSESSLSPIPQYAVQDAAWKLIASSMEGRLDRRRAVLFSTTEWIDNHDMAARLPDLAAAYLNLLGGYFLLGRQANLPHGSPPSLSPAEMEQLRSLGYIR